MSKSDLFDDMLHVVRAGGGVEQVVSERSGASLPLCSDEVPGVKEEGNPHHAEWAPLRDSTAPGVSFPKTGGKRVVNAQVFLEAGVSIDKEIGQPRGRGEPVQ